MAGTGELPAPTDSTLDPHARARLDDTLKRLAERSAAWVRTGLGERIGYLQAAIDGVLDQAEAWVREACLSRGVDPDSPQAGEEWMAGPMVTVKGMRHLIVTLQHGGQLQPRSLRTTDDGRHVARVFPRNLVDRFLYYGIEAEVWMQPGEQPTQGRLYRDKELGVSQPGRVALVLGAGNVSSIGPLDVMYKLFAEDQVVALKMNPVNAYLGPYLEKALAGLIRDGFLAVVYGGKNEGEYLCRHPGVDTVHLTGSARTHDAIVWGADPAEQTSRKAQQRPVLDKPVTAELGCVSPLIVAPGVWSDSDLEFQARQVAASVAHNASFNCTAGQVLVLAKGWPQRDAFLARLRATLARTPPRKAYYPGAQQRYEAFVERYPQAEPLGPAGEGVVPWTLVPGVAPRAGEYALREEAFCGVLAETSLEGDDAQAFLERAVAFCNDEVWGTLSCTLLAHPATLRHHAAAVERAVADLRYGNVGVNVWPGVNFGLAGATWGAYPGHTTQDIGSGRGVVHNAFLFDHPQKTVSRAPFRIWPTPVWFADHRTLQRLGPWMVRFAARRRPYDLLRVALAGIRG